MKARRKMCIQCHNPECYGQCLQNIYPQDKKYKVFNRDSGKNLGSFSIQELKEIGFREDNYIIESEA